MVAACQRSTGSLGRRLSSVVEPLMQPVLTQALNILAETFPQAFPKSPYHRDLVTHRPRLLMAGFKTQGQSTHLAPALIHKLERLPAHKLDMAALYSVSARAPEEACAQVSFGSSYYPQFKKMECILNVFPH